MKTCTAKKATVEFEDGTVSGGLDHAALIKVVLEKGNRVKVHGGTYDEQTGTVQSVSESGKTCKLVMDDGTPTGSIKIFKLELLPDEAKRAKSNPQERSPLLPEKVSNDDCFFPEADFPLLYGALQHMTKAQLEREANDEFTPPSPVKVDLKLALLKTAAKRHVGNKSCYGMDALLRLGIKKVKEALAADGALEEWVDFVELFESANPGDRLKIKEFKIDAAHCLVLFECFAEMKNKQLLSGTTKADRAEHADGKTTKPALTRSIIATAARRQAEKLPSIKVLLSGGRITRAEAKALRNVGSFKALLDLMTVAAQDAFSTKVKAARREWAMAVQLKWYGETARGLTGIFGS